MAKRAKKETIDRWRLDYWRQRRRSSNKEMAEKLDFDAGNLSAYGKGKKNPGEEFINRFYMTYPDLDPQGQEPNMNSNKQERLYNQEDQGARSVEEAQLRYMS